MTEAELTKFEDDVVNGRETIPGIPDVDLAYPANLHDEHNDLPLVPEKMCVGNGKVPKLIPNLNDKERYVLHHENLKLYLKLGLKLTKIHSGITFEEKDFMRPYIQLNTDMRTKGTTDFEKDFYKLMNNAVFGKTMENVRNQRRLEARPGMHCTSHILSISRDARSLFD